MNTFMWDCVFFSLTLLCFTQCYAWMNLNCKYPSFYGSSVESADVTQAAIKLCGNVCVCALKRNENNASIRIAYHPTILHFS